MAVFKVEKNENIVAMPSRHIKDRRLSLRAKGLFSMMLAAGDGDYDLENVTARCRERAAGVAEAARELERFGYLARDGEILELRTEGDGNYGGV